MILIEIFVATSACLLMETQVSKAKAMPAPNTGKCEVRMVWSAEAGVPNKATVFELTGTGRVVEFGGYTISREQFKQWLRDQMERRKSMAIQVNLRNDRNLAVRTLTRFLSDIRDSIPSDGQAQVYVVLPATTLGNKTSGKQ